MTYDNISLSRTSRPEINSLNFSVILRDIAFTCSRCANVGQQSGFALLSALTDNSPARILELRVSSH